MLLAVNVFLLLSAYYTIRPLRSALLLPVEIPLPGGGVMAGPEIQSYTGAILAASSCSSSRSTARSPNRLDRMRLINSVTMFFVVTLIGFFFAGPAGRVSNARGSDVLLVDGRVQPDDHRPVLVLRERPVHAGTRQAPVRHRRSRRFGRRHRRRAHCVDVHRPAGHPADDAARQRAAADRARADEPDSRARAAAPEKRSPARTTSRSAAAAASNWCSVNAICCSSACSPGRSSSSTRTAITS